MDSAGGDTVEWTRQDPNTREGKDKERQERKRVQEKKRKTTLTQVASESTVSRKAQRNSNQDLSGFHMSLVEFLGD